jgi:hypothetical protein
MEELPSEILNDKPFSLYVFIRDPKKETVELHYPSLNMESILLKVEERIEDRVNDEELQEIRRGIAEINGDLQYDFDEITFLLLN